MPDGLVLAQMHPTCCYGEFAHFLRVAVGKRDSESQSPNENENENENVVRYQVLLNVSYQRPCSIIISLWGSGRDIPCLGQLG
jgi:hypothetical protein